MSTNRPFVLSIAGFDPSGGAGVLADVKTFEQHRVYGLSVITGNTIQTENEFIRMSWMPMEEILSALQLLFKTYDIKAVKIGIVPSLTALHECIKTIKNLAPEIPIVWDTVLKSSSAFPFLNLKNQEELPNILKNITLITPNYPELLQMSDTSETAETKAKLLAQYCAVLLKGGHHPDTPGTDILFFKNQSIQLLPQTAIIYSKHGSGCVLSSAITANIALGDNIPLACCKAKRYIENFLNSNTTLLGYHETP